MKSRSLIIKSICFVCLFAIAGVFAGCGKGNSSAAVSANDENPFAVSDPGKLTSKGYELPFEYEDDYKAIIEVLPNSKYVTAEKTPGGNLKFHLTTTKSEKEVNDFYNNYFKGLQKVKAKKATDTSTGYYDKKKRLIIFNLNVWTADGVTNYKMGAEQCDKLEDSKLFEAVD